MDRLQALLAFYKDDPEDAFTRFAIASEYLKRGNKTEALAFFEELAASSPAYIGTYYHLGKLYEDLARLEDAVRIYEIGIRRATEARDLHARAELQDALLQAQGIGFDED
jgi:tetratricopeptide (TPR) repeat protein